MRRLSSLVARVQWLHTRGEPLNLSAAKRRWPTLVAKAFGLRPFLGWRGLLRTAGIDYRHIKSVLENQCFCEICGAGVGILTTHLRRVHDLNPGEYRRDYPEAELVAEQLRARQMEPSKCVSHWEPLWTTEYALDRLAEFRRLGWALNYYEIVRREPTLAGVMLRAFGSWDNALRRLGLDPVTIRRQKPGETLSAANVVERLRARHAAGSALNTAALEATDARLANAARRCFGTYAKALHAAGISARKVRLRPAAYTKADEERMLADARRVAGLKGSVRRPALDALHERWDGLVTGRCQNWQCVAERLGVPAGRLRRRRFDGAEDVLDWMFEYAEEGVDLRAGSLARNDPGLYHAALRHFDTLKLARKAADERRLR